MDGDIPLQPDTGWGTEVRELMRERSQRFDEAFATVAVRYLAEGDLRPLKDLLGRARLEPCEAVLRYLAVMLEGSGSTPFRFGFEEARRRGRPSNTKPDVKGVILATTVIMSGLRAMVEGRKPGWRFWHCLLAALDAGGPAKSRKPRPPKWTKQKPIWRTVSVPAISAWTTPAVASGATGGMWE